MYVILSNNLNCVDNLPARLVLAYFLGLCKARGAVTTSYADIAKKLGISERSAGTACRFLSANGLLNIKKVYGGFAVGIPADFQNRLESYKNCIIQKLNDSKIARESCKNCTGIMQKLHDTPYIYNIYNMESNMPHNDAKIERFSNFEDADWGKFCDQWQQHWQQVRGCDYAIDGTFTDNGQQLLRKIQSLSGDNFDISTVAASLTAMYNAADDWQRKNWSIQLINKQFNQLFANAKQKFNQLADIAANIDF